MCSVIIFFFNDTATTEIYTLSLHDALPIFTRTGRCRRGSAGTCSTCRIGSMQRRRWERWCWSWGWHGRSEEHTSELQSLRHLVCRLLLEKKNRIYKPSQYLYKFRSHPDHMT